MPEVPDAPSDVAAALPDADEDADPVLSPCRITQWAISWAEYFRISSGEASALEELSVTLTDENQCSCSTNHLPPL